MNGAADRGAHTEPEPPLADATAAFAASPGAPEILETRWGLASRYLHGSGLEIGPLHMPLVLPDDATARYVDRMDVPGLRSHYPELAGYQLAEIDVVDDGELLRTVPSGSQDFLVANHFIEHTQSPLTTLENHLRVLRPGGCLYLAVPDARETFDHRRPRTTVEHVVRDHTEGPDWSRHQHFREWAELVNGKTATEIDAETARLEAQDYSIHFHVWEPMTFVALLSHAQLELGLPFELQAMQSNGHEFIVVLRRT